jgi:hypothetical protein
LAFKGNDGFGNRICIGGYLHGVPLRELSLSILGSTTCDVS